MAFPNQVVLNRDTTSDAGDTRYRDFLIEQRQCDHIQSIDAAYQEGYNALREKIEADEGAFSDKLSDAQSAYFAYRRVMLLRKLSNLVAKKTAPGVYPPNRFLLPSCGGLSANLSQSAIVENDMEKQPDHQKLSYGSWRRVLMANRFEKRRAMFEMEYTRRLAADAMLRAELSEKIARADDALLSEERELMSMGLNPDTIDYLKRCGNQVWSVVLNMTIRNALHDPALQGSLEALGLSTVTSNSHVFSSLRYSTATDATPLDTQIALQDRKKNTNLAQRAGGNGGYEAMNMLSNPFVDVTKPRADFIRTLFGNNSTALLAGHIVTCASFMPIDSSFVALGTLGGAVLIVHVPTGRIWQVLTGHYDKVMTMKWAIEEDSTIFLTSGSADKTIRVWLVDRPVVVDLSSYMSNDGVSKGQDRKDTHRATGSKENDGPDAYKQNQSKEQKKQTGKVLTKEEELKKARHEAAKALQKAREEREFGRVRLVGGSVECVQIITTEYPILDIAFSPLTSSIIFASSVEAKDYPLLLEQEQESRMRRQHEFEMQSRVHQRRSSFSGYLSTVSRGRRSAHSSSAGRYSLHSGQGRKSSSLPPSGGNAHARSLWDRGIRGALGGLKTTAKAATKIVTLGGTIPVPASGLLLKGQDLSIRGYLCAYNVTDGTLIQKKRIQSAHVDPTMLQKSSSYITSMCFDLSGKYIYAADRKGRIHAYEVATDESNLLQQPFINHSVPYGNETLLSSTWKNVEDWRGKFVSALEGRDDKETAESSDSSNKALPLGCSFDSAKANDLHTGGANASVNAALSKAHTTTSTKEGRNSGDGESSSAVQNPYVYFTKLSIQHHNASGVSYLHALNSNNVISSFAIEFSGSQVHSGDSLRSSDYNALRSSGNFVDIHAYRNTMANRVGVLPGLSVTHPETGVPAPAAESATNEDGAGEKKRRLGLLKRSERRKLMVQVASLATDVVRVGVNLGTAGMVSVNSTPIVLKPVKNLIQYSKTSWRPYLHPETGHTAQQRAVSKRGNSTSVLSPSVSTNSGASSHLNQSPRDEAMQAGLLRGNHIGFSILPNSNSLVVLTNSSAYLVSPFRDYLQEGGGLIPPSTVLFRQTQTQDNGTEVPLDAASPQTRPVQEAFTPEKPATVSPLRARSSESPLRKVLFQSPNFSLRQRRASLASPITTTTSPSKQSAAPMGAPTSPFESKQIQVLPGSAALLAAQKAADGSEVEESQVFAKFEAPMGLASFVSTSFDGKYVLLSDVDGHITVWALKLAETRDASGHDPNPNEVMRSSSAQPTQRALSNAPHLPIDEEALDSEFSSPYVKSKTHARAPHL